MAIVVTLLGNSEALLRKSSTTSFGRPSSGYLTPKIESRVVKTYLHTYIHSSIIYTNQKEEAAQCPSTGKWINKQWKIIQTSRNSDTCNNMDET
jgi:hypothetical protein